MFETGLFAGKFLPPHKGHLWAVRQAAKECRKLVVLVCDNPKTVVPFCAAAGWPLISLSMRVAWVKEELKDEKNIVVLGMDESGVEMQPFDWEMWSNRVKKTVGIKIDAIFGSEESYAEGFNFWFKESKHVLQDPERKNVNIRGTQIRNDLRGKLDYIIPAAQEYFAKLCAGKDKCL